MVVMLTIICERLKVYQVLCFTLLRRHLMLLATLRVVYYLSSHFAVAETEAQSNEAVTGQGYTLSAVRLVF